MLPGVRCYTRGHRHAGAPRHRLPPRRPRGRLGARRAHGSESRPGARALRGALGPRPPARGAARALHAPRGDRRDGGGDLPRAQPAAHGHPQLRPQRVLHAREAARRRGGGEDQPAPHLRAGGPRGADRQPHARAHAPGRPHGVRDRRQQRRARDRRLPDAPDAPLAGRGGRVPRRRPSPRARRPHAPVAGVPQPAHQRPARGGDEPGAAPLDAVAPGAGRRPARRARGGGHGRRLLGGGRAAPLPAVLHHQGERPRPGPVDLALDRDRSRGHDRGGERTGPGRHVHRAPALGGRRRPLGGAGPRRRPAAAEEAAGPRDGAPDGGGAG